MDCCDVRLCLPSCKWTSLFEQSDMNLSLKDVKTVHFLLFFILKKVSFLVVSLKITREICRVEGNILLPTVIYLSRLLWFLVLGADALYTCRCFETKRNILVFQKKMLFILQWRMEKCAPRYNPLSPVFFIVFHNNVYIVNYLYFLLFSHIVVVDVILCVACQ